MNNIVKIILGLNIAAGGAGMFFGITKSGKVDKMKQAKIAAEAKAQTASASEGKLKTEKNAALTASSTKDGTISNLEAQLLGLQGKSTDAQKQIDDANAAKLNAQAAASSLQSDLQVATKLAGKVPGLESALEDYKNLGKPQDIKSKLDKLAKLEVGSTSGPKKKKPRKTNSRGVGTIQNHDPQLDFYVINVGSDNGIKIGDEFVVTRDNNPKVLGYIVVSRVQPTVSIAVHKKGFPRPAAPFKSGDKVGKSSL